MSLFQGFFADYPVLADGARWRWRSFRGTFLWLAMRVVERREYVLEQ